MLFRSNGQIPVFRTQSQDRMVKTAENFAAGFFGVPEYLDQVSIEILVETPGVNNSGAAYEVCNNSNIASRGSIRSTTSISVDPLEPVLGTVTSHKILQIVGDWEALGLSSSEEILHNRIGVVAEGDLDGAFKTVDVPVVASTLVGLVLSHERDQLLGGPTLALEIVVVASRRTGVHHEVD